ncbi:hypothetical protein CSA80_02650 [Candidatus Saccharibacteria bacterium]|nr:MAG: hypothetical protein CR973_02765 [Candidatus Saccharibacteria bacterium]PID98996.1 MAG: hypothetical protein CSA80_02650 [Candidatus Saccharibacteria bacterium]
MVRAVKKLRISKFRLIVAAAILLLAGGVAAFTVNVISNSRQSALQAKADAAAETFYEKTESFLTETLQKAIEEGGAEDEAISRKDHESRPAPLPSLDHKRTKEEEKASRAPYPLPYAMRLKKVQALDWPQLEAIDIPKELSSKYAEARTMAEELDEIHTFVVEKYTEKNVQQDVENNLSSFTYEIRLSYNSDASNGSAVAIFRERLAIAEKYQRLIVNDQSRKYLKKSTFKSLDKLFNAYVSQTKAVVSDLEANKPSAKTRKAYQETVATFKQIVGMEFTLSLDSFGRTYSSEKAKIKEFTDYYFSEDYVLGN